MYEGDGIAGKALNAARKLVNENELKTAYDELKRGNLYVSDNIRDYLFMYSNANEVHADRIHACVPALVYGGKIKFYYDTPRGRLFDGLVTQTNEGFEIIDGDALNQQKEELVQRTTNLFEKHIQI